MPHFHGGREQQESAARVWETIPRWKLSMLRWSEGRVLFRVHRVYRVYGVYRACREKLRVYRIYGVVGDFGFRVCWTRCPSPGAGLV